MSPLSTSIAPLVAFVPAQGGLATGPPLVFRLVAGLVAVLALAQAAFPRAMASWRMRGPGGDTTIEPSRGRLLVMRVVGLVVAAVAGLMALGGGGLLL